MSEALAELPEGWEWVKLSAVAEINPKRSQKLEREDDALTTFVPMPAVDDLTGAITAPEVKTFGEVKKGYTYFEEGDVIFAKITPCMQNGKHAVAYNLLDGFAFGSTEFHVIRPGESVIPEWIHFFVRQPSVLYDAEGRMTGAVGQQRVPKEFLAELEIPLLPLEEQQRFLEVLHLQMAEVEKARAATEVQLEAADLLPFTFLREAFEGAELRSESTRLGNVLRLRKEIVHPRNNPEGKATFVGLQHVESHTGRRIGKEDIEKSELTGRKPQFYKDDIVYGYLRPYLNKVWIAEFDGLCSVDQYVYSVDTSIADTEHVAWFMLSPIYLQAAPIDETPGQLPRIRTEEVAAVEIPLPSFEEQYRIVRVIKEKMTLAREVKTNLTAQLETISALPASLLRQAFSGELTRQPSPEDLRAALTCLAVERLHYRPFFGVVTLMKVLYFAQVQLGIPLSYTMRRHTYGPFDKTVYDLEKEGERQGWFSVDKAVDKQGSRYVPGAELDSLAREAEGTLGRWQGELNGLLDLAETFDTTGLEALATLHAAWNDLLLEGCQPTDSEIISEVLECWPGKAEKFAKDELRQYLAYLKEYGLVPQGTGHSTRLTHAA